MNKTLATRELEFKAFDYLYLQRGGYSLAMEVNVPFRGRADIVGLAKKTKRGKEREVIVLEIKTSLQDFRSKSGHNFYGHKNYYVVPQDLVDKIRDEVPGHIGIITTDQYDRVKIVKNARTIKHNYPPRFYEVLEQNIETAKQSNIRRLLKYRYDSEVKLRRK